MEGRGPTIEGQNTATTPIFFTNGLQATYQLKRESGGYCNKDGIGCFAFLSANGRARFLGREIQQEFHLVGQDPAIAQDQVFGEVRRIRHGQQFHAGFFGRAIGFAVVAALAGSDAVDPYVFAAARSGDHVLCGPPSDTCW
jgi:hypothetical protein